MSKTEKLLAVLDMPENEQWRWVCGQDLWKYFTIHIAGTVENKTFLADLAFRMRDEARETKEKWWAYSESCEQVANYRLENQWKDTAEINGKYLTDCFAIWIYLADPIDQIIAALIAKPKEAEDGK